MKQFFCKSSFTDDDGNNYEFGDVISNDVYNKLTSNQQRKFRLLEEVTI